MADPLLNVADGQIALCAASLLGVATLGRAAWLLRPHRELAAWLVAVFALALAVRVAATWGPADLAEARRWDVLYAANPEDRRLFFAIPTWLDLLASLGLDAGTLYRSMGPLAGAVAAVAAVLLARVTQLSMRWSGLAGVLVAMWPSHIHYSASGGFTVVGGALIACVYAVALGTALPPMWRVVGTASLTTVVLYTRPEYRLILPALALAAWSPHWTWRQRWATLGLWLVLAAGILPTLVSVEGRVRESDWSDHARWLLTEVRVAPVFWCWLALAGLAMGATTRWIRAVLAVAIFGLLGGYLMTTEPNFGFGLWRYYQSLWPLAAVAATLGVAGLAQRWPGLQRHGRWPGIAVSGVAVLTLLPWVPLWRTVTDLQLEFAAARSGARAALQHADLVLVPDGNGDMHTGVDHAATVLWAASLGTGWQYHRPVGQLAVSGHLGTRPVQGLESWLQAPTSARQVAAWWGVSLAATTQRQLEALGTWEPMSPQAADVLVQLPESNVRCPPAQGLGLTLRPCTLAVGWRVLRR